MLKFCILQPLAEIESMTRHKFKTVALIALNVESVQTLETRTV